MARQHADTTHISEGHKEVVNIRTAVATPTEDFAIGLPEHLSALDIITTMRYISLLFYLRPYLFYE